MSVKRFKRKQMRYFGWLRWLGALLLFLSPFATGRASAEARWWAEFYDNRILGGSPVLTRADSAISFDWGGGAPAAGVPADNFSARWTRAEYFSGGTYRFWARADDGLRLWIGDMLLIDAWNDQQGGWITRDLALSAGVRQVKLEYYEHTGGALVTLNWEQLASGQNWSAEYYGNRYLEGQPALRRTDSAIDFSWGSGSPDERIPADRFSVRWSQSIGSAAGAYRVFASSDDGVRIWVDDRLVVDAWYNQSLPNTHSGDVELSAGSHQIVVEYYEDRGQAGIRVWWQQLGGTTPPVTNGWQGEYYGNVGLEGNPLLVRDDSEINFDWGAGAPASWLPSDNFSVRWSRQTDFAAGYYNLSVRSDDGVRVWVNNQLLIDQWREMANELHTADGVYLSGTNQLTVEYYERSGFARVHFWVSPGGNAPPAPATVIVDDDDPGFIKGGAPTSWRSASVGHDGRLTWTRNNDYTRSNYNWGRWHPNLAPGRYEVFAYIPPQFASTENARYWVRHADAFSLRVVDQSIYYGEWVSLGTYDFDGDGDEYVSLSDVTYERYLSRMIAFDAVKWVRR